MTLLGCRSTALRHQPELFTAEPSVATKHGWSETVLSQPCSHRLADPSRLTKDLSMAESVTQYQAMRTNVVFAIALALLMLSESSYAQRTPFEDEPVAHRLFDRMHEAFREADSLSFDCQFEKEALCVGRTACTYHVWLRKPNLFRVEVESESGERGGVMIGDGNHLWIHWPNGRPRFPNLQESDGQEGNRFKCFMKKPAANAANISIWHEMPLLGNGAGFPKVEVSIFHGHVDSLSKHIDGVRELGNEVIDGLSCRKIEVSMLDHQRSHYLWLSERDQLPRRLVELVRLDHDVITREVWSSVRVNEEITESHFLWSPPHAWQAWSLPADEDAWPKIGSQAPDFELSSIDDKRLRLSSYRGKVVWLNFWRMGCPPCIEELPELQSMHSRFGAKGLELIGINVSDDRKQLARLLETQRITYPNVLDTSEPAKEVYESDYGVGAIPLHCIIDRHGLIVDVWIGFSKDRAVKAILAAGIDE